MSMPDIADIEIDVDAHRCLLSQWGSEGVAKQNH
jgi:hypothetical protein